MLSEKKILTSAGMLTCWVVTGPAAAPARCNTQHQCQQHQCSKQSRKQRQHTICHLLHTFKLQQQSGKFLQVNKNQTKSNIDCIKSRGSMLKKNYFKEF